MKQPIYPCLWFDGHAREAAQFYCSVFRNSGIKSDTPIVATFELDGMLFMGLNGGPMFKMNPSISMYVACQTAEEADEIWNKLMAGGKTMMAMGKYPWSEKYGWLMDKFGFTWQVTLATGKGEEMLTPCMLFTNTRFGQAEAAIKFYTSLFENSSIDNIKHYPAGEHEGKVLFSEFRLNKKKFIAMDGPGEHAYTFNEGISLVVSCDTQKEIDYYWNKLTEGGEESMCGWLKDQFGVSWQIVPEILGRLMTDKDKAPRVAEAFMKMRKFDIKTLTEA